MKVYVSTINFGFGPLPELLQQISDPVYLAVEVSSGHPATPVAKESTEATLRYQKDNGASVILHNFAPPEPGDLLINLSEPDNDRRQQVIEFLKSRIDLTKELGSDYYSFHGGYRVPYRFGVSQYTANDRLSREQALETFMWGLREVLAHAEAKKIHIGVENHVVDTENAENVILFDQPDFEFMFNRFSSEYLHLHLDTGHIKVSSQALGFDPYSFINAFQDKIMVAHLHDNSGAVDEHHPFAADAWFLNQLGELPDLQYVCLETKTGGDHQRICQMVSLLKGLK